MTEILVLALGLILTAGMLEKLYVYRGKIRRFFGFSFGDVHEIVDKMGMIPVFGLDEYVACYRYWTFFNVELFRIRKYHHHIISYNKNRFYIHLKMPYNE